MLAGRDLVLGGPPSARGPESYYMSTGQVNPPLGKSEFAKTGLGPWRDLVSLIPRGGPQLRRKSEQARLVSFDDAFRALGLGTRIPEDIPLAVEARYEHRATVFLTSWLVVGNDWSFSLLWRDVSQAFAEAPTTRFLGASEILNRVICVERCNRRLHCPVVLVTQGKQVSSHAIPRLGRVGQSQVEARCDQLERTGLITLCSVACQFPDAK